MFSLRKVNILPALTSTRFSEEDPLSNKINSLLNMSYFVALLNREETGSLYMSSDYLKIVRIF